MDGRKRGMNDEGELQECDATELFHVILIVGGGYGTRSASNGKCKALFV